MQSLLSQAILSAVALAVTAQIPLCPYHAHLTEELRNCHGPELSSNEAFNTLSEFSKRYEEYCARKIAPQMSVSELHVHRCADKQFNRLFYRCWADMLRSDYSLNSAGVDNHDLAVFKKSLDCQFHVLEIEP
uniref:Putative conserved secreted protein fat body overexpressed n=1 Tax=Rhipicephalus microplus TaxID=6941 RepID=A0A6M2D4L0_RHIMP